MQQRWACRSTAERLLEQTRKRVAGLVERGIEPHLAVVLVGKDPASQVYVRNKIRTCGEMGIRSTFRELDSSTTTQQLLDVVHDLNEDNGVHGILVQLPLPKQIDESAIIAAVDPDKDVDGFHPVNVGRLSIGEAGLFPCTPMGVMALLEDCGMDLKGKHAVVVGRSNIVGKPMAQLLLAKHCTVTVMHSRTQNPQDICKTADLVIAAVGVPGLVNKDWLKPGAYVVDVGMNEITDPEVAGRLLKDGSKKARSFEEKSRILYGDVHYHSALEVAGKVTPVPGGVGPLTIAHLMVNCVTAAERKA